MSFSEDKIVLIVRLLKYFYLLSVILLTIAIFLIWLGGGGVRIEATFGFLINIILYTGLSKRKSWVVPTILILTSLSIVFQIIFPVFNVITLVAKIFSLSLSVFIIYFFSRKEVREYFNSKGIYIFGI